MENFTQVPARRCPRCRIVKPLAEFYSGEHGRKKPCRKCFGAYRVEHIRPREEFLRAYRLERGCADCGWNKHWAALEFDHRPGTVKLMDVSQCKFKGSWQVMLDEVAKCDVVCANCHRIRTIERNDSGRNAGWDLRRAAALPVIEPYGTDAGQLSFDWTA